MYTPQAFKEDDPETLRGLIRDYPFATLITPGEGLQVTHLPLLLDSERGPHGTLVGHVARANPHWQALEREAESLAIFHGPHAYVSPSWYETELAVPTWNYAVVHAHGRARIIEDTAQLRGMLAQLVDTFESGRPKPWSMGALPDDWLGKVAAGIVGFEIEITRLEGKFKLSQNRPVADRLHVAEELAASPYEVEREVARLVSERIHRA